MKSNLILKEEIIQKNINKKTCKKKIIKKIGLNLTRKNPRINFFLKKDLKQNKIAIKEIRIKLERLENHKE
jgi:hypothetical protein